MQEQFKSHINERFPELKNKHFLLACSGGIDSVILVHLCKAIGLEFSLAHCNFNLRGLESDADEAFVKLLAADFKIPFYVTSFDTAQYMNTHKVSLQIAARELRYAWFSELQSKHKIPTLVTAHHADDSLETFLINLSRGTGIDGLTGIPERTPTIARPLLLFSREQILDYAHRFTISWREDKSNQETKYLRNKIRHKIVPHLKELHPSFLPNFLQSQQHLAETASLLNHHIQELRATLFKKDGDGFVVSIAALKKQNALESLVYHLFKPFGFSDAEALIALLSAMSGKELHSVSHRLLKDRDNLYLKGVQSISSDIFEIEEECNSVTEPVSIKIEVVSEITTTGIDTLYVDKNHLKFPLTVRKYKTGDYFYPFGMKGVKKLSKYFKDEKFSQFQKEQQWLLCSEDAIVWVIGKRADDRFKVSKKTDKILKFSLVQ
ncbi:tRNA(Ile)-lysidine synthase [Cellulophaga algicola DSM 14237]|uniref:tRNA(Ile)-lysidine synthase n=1 Tax=Cellulophaga algicola (strain DSM 14237 / IC166 / ACAM 630) TaxID=688270 RepID=E6X983_CELAD|nr:tRNA lysidine(34) synthetase TilS [Cellulophaga algicola]ADV50893.1 tRNA(Ile)-lysidine synthase [Cellulophaga algicola DSM 14237]